MNRRRRRHAKLRRKIARVTMQLRPEGGPRADNGHPASSIRSRVRDFYFLLRHNAPAPEWY